MEPISHKQSRYSASVWLFGVVILAVIFAIVALSFRKYGVFADPLTEGRRWIIIDRDYTLLLTLVPTAFLLVAVARINYFRAKIREVQVPTTWSTVETAMSHEEEREGKIIQRFPKLLTYMVKAFEAPCIKDGVIVKALVIARHNSTVLFSPLEHPMFFVGEIDGAGKMTGLQHFPKVAQAVEVFLDRVSEAHDI